MSRFGIFTYGLLSYAVFLGVFVYAIGFIGGFVTPTTLDGAPTMPMGMALAIDLGLLTLFAVQHSGMARPAFKRWFTKFVPEAAERSTYVLMSSLLLVGLFVMWQPIGGVVWDAPEGAVRTTITVFYMLGWALLLYTTFLIDHFDLFGLKQVWRALLDRPYVAPQFHTPSLYRVVRHPLYIGWLMIFWFAPTMTIAHLVFAAVTTAYILVAIQFEERDLVDAFGDTYENYRKSTPMLIPKVMPERQDTKSSHT
ncbi:MAG: isoprenylcysteine carboxylmethyltransferase family protein [Hyphomonadaceae bacterium]